MVSSVSPAILYPWYAWRQRIHTQHTHTHHTHSHNTNAHTNNIRSYTDTRTLSNTQKWILTWLFRSSCSLEGLGHLSVFAADLRLRVDIYVLLPRHRGQLGCLHHIDGDGVRFCVCVCVFVHSTLSAFTSLCVA